MGPALIVGGVEEIVENYIKVLLLDPKAEYQLLGMELAFGKCLRAIACFSGTIKRF